MLGFQTYVKFFETNECSIVSLNFLEKLSASVFCVPGMCAADTHIFCDVHHTHSSFAILLQNSDLIPPLLFTNDTAVMLSDSTLRCF